ncbi:hypothetical protein PUW41_08210 [Streptococcus anginosus]|uniref:hypothetical protein n=3 Tax=Streptococcus anginosus TaxID=1328 RepID=UPI0021F8B59E|nr:hypothetical protein [Streptococcus anginosus]MBS6902371.1 hypothetical protein [Streptococcus anginosus]MCW0950907.1 hypothetical protein [Streptococcus anginosus]MCW0978912.1 hypothetical protein [Streptococcus anginosus]MCW0994757.1 hypothetical protein [Streptococcus anginosus]MCW1002338.1 hypothetical protein [Streptococcus anginosus]
MQNYEQMRLIMDWERDHYRLGNSYKNKLAKKPIEVVKQELAEIAEEWNSVSFSVVPKGAMKIEGDKTTIFKKR